MQGSLLGYDAVRGEGVISGADSRRYRFTSSEWRGDMGLLVAGASVDFDVAEDAAVGVYPVARARSGAAISPATADKTPIVAGLLALFLGGFGVHKFYMGYSNQGVILLVSTIVSWILTFILIGILPLMAIGVICLVEAIILLTKSQDEFERVYLSGSRPWF